MFIQTSVQYTVIFFPAYKRQVQTFFAGFFIKHWILFRKLYYSPTLIKNAKTQRALKLPSSMYRALVYYKLGLDTALGFVEKMHELITYTLGTSMWCAELFLNCTEIY
jgi:uncharacterized protein YebE (UPF0316 family)